MNHIAATAMSEGERDPSLTNAALWKLLKTLGSEAEDSWRASQDPYQTTQNLDNLGAYVHSFEHLCVSARSLKEKL